MPWEPGTLELPHKPKHPNRAYRGANALHLTAIGARKASTTPSLNDRVIGTRLSTIIFWSISVSGMKLMTIKDVTKKFGVSETRVYSHLRVRKPLVPHVRLGGHTLPRG